MSQDKCEHCHQPFKRYKNREDQHYCGRSECQKARKAKWKRQKIKKDTEYRAYHNQTNKDWNKKSPGYWKEYRNKNPEKTERNRILQRVRNHNRRQKIKARKTIAQIPKNIAKMDTLKLIAKVDALKSNNHQVFNQFWLVPVIAKVDVLKAHILLISDKSKRSSDAFF